MRTIKRFTPKLIRKWIGLRGIGVYGEYVPWHQISRGDPSSKGRSHLTFCPIHLRLRHQLSDYEQVVLGFSLMVEDYIDIKEQNKLCTGPHQNELSKYDSKYSKYHIYGTLDFAEKLGFKHPKVYAKGEAEPWIMTTDFLVVYAEDNKKKLLAIAFKLEKDLTIRNRQLLAIEKAYWEAEGAEWILITDRLIDKKIHSTILRNLSWVLHAKQIPKEIKSECINLQNQLNGLPLNVGYELICNHFNVDLDIAQIIFWQSVWAGCLPLDLKMWHFATEKINLLSKDSFKKQNPVLARRSSWI